MEIDGDMEPELEEIEAQYGSCSTSLPDGAGMIWLNYRAENIGCGFGTPDFTDTIGGFTLKGRILCAHNWLESNQPSVISALGNPIGNERYYQDDGATGTQWLENQAWVSDFENGRIQFQFFGPCGFNGQHGYLKVYMKGESQGQVFNEKDCRADADCPAGDDGWGHCDYDPEKGKNVCKRKRCTDENGCPAFGLHADPVTYCKDAFNPNSTYCGPSNSHAPCQGSHVQYTVTYSFWNEAEGRCKNVGGLPLITCTGAAVTVNAPAGKSCQGIGYPHFDAACVQGPRATGTYLNGLDVPVNAFRCAHQ
jgi:hypothetical protein